MPVFTPCASAWNVLPRTGMTRGGRVLSRRAAMPRSLTTTFTQLFADASEWGDFNHFKSGMNRSSRRALAMSRMTSLASPAFNAACSAGFQLRREVGQLCRRVGAVETDRRVHLCLSQW
ncbi:hypothetical protein GCM10010298_28310 [Streptomyces microflavus]|nr:hypothetical protein GCM10010298_28310 [Streptomyces microflavus]